MSRLGVPAVRAAAGLITVREGQAPAIKVMPVEPTQAALAVVVVLVRWEPMELPPHRAAAASVFPIQFLGSRPGMPAAAAADLELLVELRLLAPADLVVADLVVAPALSDKMVWLTPVVVVVVAILMAVALAVAPAARAS